MWNRLRGWWFNILVINLVNFASLQIWRLIAPSFTMHILSFKQENKEKNVLIKNFDRL